MKATCGPLPAPIPGAIAGHSFGAYTSQLFAGAEIDVPGDGTRRFKDDRFAAAILLSAQGLDQQGLRKGSWNGVTGPMLNVTGTLDGGAKGQDWHWKVEPYELAPVGDKYLAVLMRADHYLGGLARPDQSLVPAQWDAVAQLTLAFLDAHVGRTRRRRPGSRRSPTASATARSCSGASSQRRSMAPFCLALRSQYVVTTID